MLSVCRSAKEQLTNSLPSLLFRLEQAQGPEDMAEVVNAALMYYSGPEYEELCSLFAQWALHIARRIDLAPHDVPEIISLQEVGRMLETNCLRWKEQYIEQGEKKGREESEKAGDRNGRMAVARNLAAYKMGVEQIVAFTGLSRDDVESVCAAVQAM